MDLQVKPTLKVWFNIFSSATKTYLTSQNSHGNILLSYLASKLHQLNE